MGAAISTLAGSNLILNAQNWSFIQEILPFLKGFTHSFSGLLVLGGYHLFYFGSMETCL